LLNKLIVDPQDIILNIQNSILIIEKLKFVDKYTALIAQNPQYDIKKLEQVCTEIKKSNLTEMTLNKIKEIYWHLL
jgi:hypothetical protein